MKNGSTILIKEINLIIPFYVEHLKKTRTSSEVQKNSMKLFVNNEEITIYHGARVLDVIRAYYVQHNKKLPRKLPIVCDAYGNSIAPDGELSEGNHLHIKI